MRNWPAQKAGIEVGDRILSFDGKPQRDFTKIHLNVAMVHEGQSVPVVVEKPNHTQRALMITAERSDNDNGAFLQLGILPSPELRAPDLDKRAAQEVEKARAFTRSGVYTLDKGEAITAI